MGYQNTTGSLNLPYPDGAEDLDVPGDLQLLAEAVDANVSSVINSNVVTDAQLHVNEVEDKVEIIGSVMHIYLTPPDISLKYDKAGGTISGNLTVTGTSTLEGAVTVPTPTQADHAATKQYVDNSTPIGLVAPFAGLTLPTGWYWCDGLAHGNAALEAAIGSPNTPDLTGMFVVGSSGTTGNWILGNSYGASSVTLTDNELPSHTHTIGAKDVSHTHGITVNTGGGSKTPAGSISSTSVNHYHSGSTGTESHDHTHSGTTGWMNQNNPHTHDAYTREGITSGDSNSYIDSADAYSPTTLRWDTVVNTSTDINHTHSFSTGGRSAAHTHSFSTGYMSANSSHGHTFTGSSLNINHGHTASSASAGGSHDHSATATGSGNAFPIIPPAYALRYIIFGGS